MTDDKAAEARERKLFEARFYGALKMTDCFVFNKGRYAENYVQEVFSVWQDIRAPLLASIAELEAQVASARDDGLLREAVANLVAVKGRYNTEIAYKRLELVFVNTRKSSAREAT